MMTEKGNELERYETLSSEVVWSCPWYRVRRDEIMTPSGVAGEYNVVEKGAAVWVVPVTAAGELVLIRNYRYTVDDVCWEVPAGNVPAGKSLAEAAVMELKEEVGGTAAAWHYVGQFYTANGICNEVSHIFVALGVELGVAVREATEVMAVHRRPWAEGVRMALANEISDGPSALAILLARGYVDDNLY
ncbi:MAG TPA: NUDIX hydrolase [Anaerolineae bacterium]|nr:NUDIX hydrolase [Anaerolineae bacterium]